MTIRYERLRGDGLRDRLTDLARLRIEVFRAWPYLYAGSADYEARNLEIYAAAPHSVIVAALDGDRLIGAATGLPLTNEPETLTGGFVERGWDVETIFYFGESVLLPHYRGRGIGVAFFREREAAALELPAITHAAFCGVARPDDHPARPAGHVPLDGFWRNRGYQRLDGVTGRISWQDLGGEAETEKVMQFWIRRLR